MAHRQLTGAVVIATHNPGKLAEMRDLLSPYNITATSAAELNLAEPDETGKTFAANARINAFGDRYFEPAPERHFYGGLAIRYNFGRGQQ